MGEEDEWILGKGMDEFISFRETPGSPGGTHKVQHFQDAWVVAPGQGPGAQKASAGLALFR